jgi:tetratricopeptide (TPR) repeat protein
MLKRDLRTRTAAVVLLLAISAVFFLMPYRWIHNTRAAEKRLVQGAQSAAEYLKGNYGDGFSLALTTIGSASYHLGTGVTVIDMLGLTDKHISRHPEKLKGITVTWKEKKYNSQYVLSRDPDFILFSTGYKPSAPAERALLLNSEFRQNYHVVPIFLKQGGFWPLFKRKGEYLKENEVLGDSRFVDLFYAGENYYTTGRRGEAIETMKQAASVSPEDFALVYELLGQYHFASGEYPAAEEYLKKAIEIDDYSVVSHFLLATMYDKDGRNEEAENERRKVYLYDPNFPW